MPRYRIRYSREGTARFISHLDMIRTFERAIRRAGLPVSLSQGFNPHPKMAFGMPLPVGVAGLGEYLDLDLDKPIPPAQVADSIGKNLPPGVSVTGAWEVDEREPALMASVERSFYIVFFDRDDLPAGAGNLKICLEEIMASPELTVVRRKKDGRESRFDVRPGILGVSVREQRDGVELEMEILTGSAFNVRPEEVLSVIKDRGAIKEDSFYLITRVRSLGAGGKELFPGGC